MSQRYKITQYKNKKELFNAEAVNAVDAITVVSKSHQMTGSEFWAQVENLNKYGNVQIVETGRLKTVVQIIR